MTHLRRLGFIDERFLDHRRRASSLAGFASVTLAMVLFVYYSSRDHVLRYDLLAIGLTFVVVKYAAFIWYRMRD